MKPKNFALVALLVAILGAVLWWLWQTTTLASQKTAETLSPAKANALNITTQVGQVAQPKLPAVTPNSAAATPASANPQTDLKTAISDIVRLYRANDMKTLEEKYTPPDEFDPIQLEAELKDAADSAAKDPEFQNFQKQLLESKTHSWEALESQTPAYNATGDEATYVFVSQYPGLSPTVIHQHFVKIDGKWYIGVESD